MTMVKTRALRLMAVMTVTAGAAMLSGCGPTPYSSTTTTEQSTSTRPNPMETTTTTTMQRNTRP